jgi:hypothetical protein
METMWRRSRNGVSGTVSGTLSGSFTKTLAEPSTGLCEARDLTTWRNVTKRVNVTFPTAFPMDVHCMLPNCIELHRIASKSIEVHRSPSNSGIQHVSVHVQTKFVLGASRFCMPSENHNDQSNLEIWVNTRTCKAEAICFPSFPFLHHCKWQIDPNCESPLFNLCWKFVAHEPEQKFDRIPQKTQRCKSETSCLPWKRVLLFAQPPLPRFLFLHLSFHLLAREVAPIGFWGRSCFSYRVCIFLSAPVWSVALLAVLPEKPSWNSFVALLSVCSLSIIEFWRQCKYWLLIKLAMPSGTCWIWNQPLWSFASQLLHEWAAGGTWRWERQ